MATQFDIANHLGISVQRVRELERAGVLPGGERCERDLGEAVRAYTAHLRADKGGWKNGDPTSLAAERARLTQLKASVEATRLAELEGALVRKQDVDRAVIAAFTAVRRRLEALPARLAREAAETPAAEVRRSAERLVAEALAELEGVAIGSAGGAVDAA